MSQLQSARGASFPEQQDQPVALGAGRFLSRAQHVGAGDHEDCAEEVGDDVEMVEQRDSRQHEPEAQDHRAHDAAIQHAMLRARADAERAKNNQEDENIVGAERFFKDVGGDEFNAGLASAREVDPEAKAERESNPCGAFDERVLQGDAIGLRAEDGEIGRDGNGDQRSESHPHTDRLSTHLAGSRRLPIDRRVYTGRRFIARLVR